MSDILTLAHEVADELSLTRPSVLVNNETDDEAVKFLRHMTRTCRQLAIDHDWSFLQREQTFTTVAQAVQTGAIPDDFLRFIDSSMYDRTRRVKVWGPLNAREWQIDQTSPSPRFLTSFRVRGTSLLLSPTPDAGNTVAFEYITKTIGANVDGDAERTDFSEDTDIPYFDAELVILGTVWRYKKAEGTDYSEEFRQYQLRKNTLWAVDGGRRIMDMGGESRDTNPSVNGDYLVEDLTTI